MTLVLPLVIPLGTAIVLLLLRERRLAQRILSIVSASAMLIVALTLAAMVWTNGPQTLQASNWPAPFGISLVADLFSAGMNVVVAAAGLLVAIYSLASIERKHERYGYFPIYFILLAGVSGAFLTGDVFNLYVWFEVLLIASFVLMALGNERQQLEGAMKYVVLSLISSLLFLAACGLLYGMVGTLNMADAATQLARYPNPGLVVTLGMLFFLAFGIKAAAFPVFSWLPASYHTPPVAVSGIFAALLTKVGVYAIVRVFTLLFTIETDLNRAIIITVAVATMITGVIGAVAQSEFRRVLAFHSISQVGYMILGLGLGSPLALAGAFYYVIHHSIVKMNLFLISGVTLSVAGTNELKKLSSFYRVAPALSFLFIASAFSLAGVPPLTGFWAKLLLVQAGLNLGQYAAVAAALGVGVFTLISMTKIWAEAFWKEPKGEAGASSPKVELIPLPFWTRVGLYLPIVVLAVLTIGLGVWVDPLLAYTTRAAEQLLNPAVYLQAVGIR